MDFVIIVWGKVIVLIFGVIKELRMLLIEKFEIWCVIVLINIYDVFEWFVYIELVDGVIKDGNMCLKGF